MAPWLFYLLDEDRCCWRLRGWLPLGWFCFWYRLSFSRVRTDRVLDSWRRFVWCKVFHLRASKTRLFSFWWGNSLVLVQRTCRQNCFWDDRLFLFQWNGRSYMLLGLEQDFLLSYLCSLERCSGKLCSIQKSWIAFSPSYRNHTLQVLDFVPNICRYVHSWFIQTIIY